MMLHIHSTPTTTACALVAHILKQIGEHPDRMFNIAFSGGSTPAVMFDVWAHHFVDVTPWRNINFWWVDERCVPPHDPESNFGLMDKLLLSVVPVPPSNVFRIHGEADPQQEAARYAALVKEHLPQQEGCPVFDMVLLGVGSDGHTSSIFPGQTHLLSSPHTYEVSVNPHTKQKRIALTGNPIIHAAQVVFLATGEDKAKVCYDLYTSDNGSPSAYVAHRANAVELFTDTAGAALITSDEKGG